MKLFMKLVLLSVIVSYTTGAFDITALVTPDQVQQMIGNVKDMVRVSGDGTVADVMITRISELPGVFVQGVSQLQNIKSLEAAALALNLMKNPEIFVNLVITQLSRFNDPFVQRVSEFVRSFRDIIVVMLVELKPFIAVLAKAFTDLNASAKMQGSITQEALQHFKSTLQDQLHMNDIADHLRQKITQSADLFNVMAQNLISL